MPGSRYHLTDHDVRPVLVRLQLRAGCAAGSHRQDYCLVRVTAKKSVGAAPNTIYPWYSVKAR